MSHPTVICGKDCSIQLASSNVSGHLYTVSLSGREKDVTSFGSSKYGRR